MKQQVVIAALLFLLSGCALKNNTGPDLHRRHGQRLVWHSAANAMPVISVFHGTEISQNGAVRFRYQGVYENNQDALVLVGLTPLGTRAFALSLNANGRQFEKLPFYRMPISAEDQLFYWAMATLPLVELQKGLVGLRLTELPSGRRLLKRADHLVATIDLERTSAGRRYRVVITHRHPTKQWELLFQVHDWIEEPQTPTP